MLMIDLNCSHQLPREGKTNKDLGFQQEMIDLEKKKLQWLAEKDDEDDDDLHFFKSLKFHI